MAQITVTDLSLGYEGRVLLEHLNLTVNVGDYLCIVGENGSGKSTFVRTLLGLQKPLSGTISFGEGLQQNEIGYLPQQTDVQKDFPASVREIVRSGCQGKAGFRPFYNKAEKELADANLEEMGIAHLANRCYRELSGGQQQRVLLARALCATGKVLLLDEPVAGLDPKATEDLYACIGVLNQKGITILMVSHDLEATRQSASHILHIGNQVFFGTKEEYLEREKTFWRGGDAQ